MFKRFITRLILKVLDPGYGIDYRQIDKKAVSEFMYRSFDDKGWRSYFAFEDLKILKEMGVGKGPWDYPVLVGRRLQLMYIFNEMKQEFERRKAAAEKAQSQAQGDNSKP